MHNNTNHDTNHGSDFNSNRLIMSGEQISPSSLDNIDTKPPSISVMEPNGNELLTRIPSSVDLHLRGAASPTHSGRGRSASENSNIRGAQTECTLCSSLTTSSSSYDACPEVHSELSPSSHHPTCAHHPSFSSSPVITSPSHPSFRVDDFSFLTDESLSPTARPRSHSNIEHRLSQHSDSSSCTHGDIVLETQDLSQHNDYEPAQSCHNISSPSLHNTSPQSSCSDSTPQPHQCNTHIQPNSEQPTTTSCVQCEAKSFLTRITVSSVQHSINTSSSYSPSPNTDLQLGDEDLKTEVVDLLSQHYDIHEVLGKGISSTVRRVTEKNTGVEFAVKIIDISGSDHDDSRGCSMDQLKRDTFREIRLLRLCAGHPNIIELHDVFETPAFIFLVFEICKKGELFDYLTSVVSLSEKRTRIFMRQLIEAVQFLHEKNIVHRDLKPENILLDDNLNIKLSDFGFATIVEDGEELSELCGTPGYLAPEVLAHSMYEDCAGYGREVDMWACGVIMYTLLCGAPPFWNRKQMYMLRAIMAADYTFNSPEWDDISDAPKELIKQFLVVTPSLRITAKESLAHPFFESKEAKHELKQLSRKIRMKSLISFALEPLHKKDHLVQEHKLPAIRRFRLAVHSVVFIQRLIHFSKHPAPISVETLKTNPYSIKLMRKVIDTAAFGMYKHWVKRVDNQNRAALFEHTLREDWKHTMTLQIPG